MVEGSTKYLIGAAVGAVGGFAAGSFVTTPTARSFGKSTIGGIAASAGFAGRVSVKVIDRIGSALEAGYTRIRGREKYLEQEITELREQITRLEQRMD